jgi:sec-independent protein translocase protein TatA
MGPVGTPEIIFIAVLVLVLFGAKKLPTFARSMGRSLGEFKKARMEFEHEMQRAINEAEREEREAESKKLDVVKPVSGKVSQHSAAVVREDKLEGS